MSWRWCLYVNVPFALIAVAGALLLLKRQAKPENARGLDVPGILVVIAGLVALIYGLSSAESNGWGSATTLTCIGLGAALLAVFAVIEERVEDPLLPLPIIWDRTRGGSYLTLAIIGTGMFAVFLFLTYLRLSDAELQPVEDRLRVRPDGPCRHGRRQRLIRAGAPHRTQDPDLHRAAPRRRRHGPVGTAGAHQQLRREHPPRAGHRRLRHRTRSGVSPQCRNLRGRHRAVWSRVRVRQRHSAARGRDRHCRAERFAATAASDYLEGKTPTPANQAPAGLESYTTVFWWAAGIFAVGAVTCGALLRSGPIETDPDAAPVVAH
ncbi:hypothetical protein OG991_55260 [Streptomyces mirabilis]|nr:hypothetical protein [Streptomyces mirabilis]MCX4428477.1 hypothetical protein [Streptomyces mirabilis]